MDIRAVIFVPALAGSVILGFVFLLFAANYYLTIMESSGVGAKEVTWHSEPVLDYAPKLAYMAWLVGLWLGPAYLLGRDATSGVDAAWIKLAVPLAVFWLCFPVSQLSSLSASTIWLPLVPDVFARLLQKPVLVVEFLILTAPVLAAFGLGFQWAFLTAEEWNRLFIGTPIMVASGFLYARLIGRLAFALRYTRSLFREKKEKKPKTVDMAAIRPPESVVRQPSELPPISTPDEGDLTGYDIKFEGTPPPPPRKRMKAVAVETEDEPSSKDEMRNEDEETVTGYGFGDEPEPPRPSPKPETKNNSKSRQKPEPRPKKNPQLTRESDFKSDPVPDELERRPPRRRRQMPPKDPLERSRVWTDEDDSPATAYGVHKPEADPVKETLPESLMKPSEEELKLLRRDDAPKPAKRIWSSELLVFLGQQGTVMAFVIASGLCGLAGTMVRVARMFNPVGSGD